MITVDQLLESARQSAAAAAQQEPVLACGSCGRCGTTFLVRLESAGRYQLDCPSDDCRARVQVEG